ncbi:MAG: hypothetical protein LIP03_15965 [Bacteroidales bacterium]|nr:hypothetical protein [Bacteroidales bacterium]
MDLLKLVLEIEGCLRVLQARDDEAAKTLLLEKIDLLKSEADALYAPCAQEFTPQMQEAIDMMIPQIEPEPTPEPEPQPQSEPEPQPVDNIDNLDTIDNIDHVEPIDNAETPKPIEPTPQSAPADNLDKSSTTIRIEDVISNRELSDFTKAFTINDKFRFSRELFGNSQVQFTETVNLVSAMESLDEAYDYFLNDLGWDADNETVSEFLGLVANHFNALG